jgi:hypothetical protein
MTQSGQGKPILHLDRRRVPSFCFALCNTTEREMALRKARFWLLAALIIAVGILGAPSLYRTAVLGSGVLAQLLCSSTFVSRRDPQAVVAEELSGPGYELLSFFQWSVDPEGKRVTASLFGLGRRSALFRDGLGCTLVIGIPEAN